MKKTVYPWLALIVALCFPMNGVAERTLFSLNDVKLLDSPFLSAQNTDIKYILSLDADRLLAPFYREAGLTPKKASYGNWENTGLDGHTAGHYLTALAQTYAITGDKTILERLTYSIDELKRCQDAVGTGFIGGTPGSLKLWESVSKATFTMGNGLNNTWVPWYNLHKTFAGLRDAWLLTGNEKAKVLFLKLSDWCCSVIANLSEDQMQRMIGAEYGGMNEVLADAYVISGDRKYLEAAKRFSHKAILDPLLQHVDKLTGLHANTQIPKVIGFERIGELTNDSSWIDAAKFFWYKVTTERSIAIGGNSVSEHFNPVNDFSSMVQSKEGPETCNTYNMLKLSRMLWVQTGETRYLDFYEKAMFNHILSSQHPEGGFVYFTPIRPRHYRVYSESQESFWCCVGTGLENHTKYGELIYAYDNKTLFVNLYVPSVLTWKAAGLTLTQRGDLSKDKRVSLSLTLTKKSTFVLQVRKPSWTGKDKVLLTVNGKSVTYTTVNNYLVINRSWSNGDKIDLTLPMHLNLEFLPDGSKWAAFTYGPWVLGAETEATDLVGLKAGGSRMGHVANGPMYPLDQAPSFMLNSPSVDSLLTYKGSNMRFSIKGTVSPATYATLELKPFYQIHDSRYMLYWNVLTSNEFDQLQDKLRAEEAVRMILNARTVDQVKPGEQQPEKEHNLQFDRNQTGFTMDRLWRRPSTWFSYDLKNPKLPNLTLLVTYNGNDVNGTFLIKINNEPIKTVTLTDGKKGQFYNEEYQIPTEVLQRATGEILTVKFEAAAGSRPGGIYDVRLLRP